MLVTVRFLFRSDASPSFLSPLMSLYKIPPVAYQYPREFEEKAVKLFRPARVNMTQLDEKRLITFLKDQLEADKGLFTKEKEILFLGRSNVGKSSLLNALFQAKVCRVAKRTGTTRQLHFHGLEVGKGVLVDVPGYGYAKMNSRRRQLWLGSVFDYLKVSSRVCKAYILVSLEHGPQQADLRMMQKIDPLGVEYQLIVTKCDRIPAKQLWKKGLALGQQLGKFQFRHLNPLLHFVSSETGFGVPELREGVAYSLEQSVQRDVDGKEQLLIDYLATSRVTKRELSKQEQRLSKSYEIKKLFYASKYSRYLSS